MVVPGDLPVTRCGYRNLGWGASEFALVTAAEGQFALALGAACSTTEVEAEFLVGDGAFIDKGLEPMPIRLFEADPENPCAWVREITFWCFAVRPATVTVSK
ncbi:hypothetical protein KC363_g100 [Hortaea werneckii]|nr:hypothetical protein KC363_g100 [Hortaea werneckii]